MVGAGNRALLVSRRRALTLGGAGALAATALPACDALSTDPASEAKDGAGSGNGRQGKEAPMLAERVKQGKLPALKERLPEKPLVVKPVERPGVYGGTWTSATLGPTDSPWLDQVIDLDGLLDWNHEETEQHPEVAQGVDVNEDGTVYTFHLRKGMKWSDGKPLTADDICFAQNDVYNDTDLYPTPPDPARKAEKIDDHTVRIVLERPAGLFLQFDAGQDLVTRPKHYLKRFHKKYNEDIHTLVHDQGFPDWMDLFNSKTDIWQNPEIPVLHGWIVTQGYGKGPRVTLERNPYYYKTDPDGRQLPYIDKLIFDVVQSPDVMMLKATHGELDMHMRHFNTLANKPVLARNEKKGGYALFDTTPAVMNTALLIFNLTHKDPVQREIHNNRDLRIGLSYAINRQEIIDAVYQRQGEPWQCAPRKEAELYDEEMAKQFTEHDPEKANHHLDRAGYTKRDGDGFRLGPDGTRIRLRIEYASGFKPGWPDALTMVRGYWKKVGVDARVNPEDRSLFLKRNQGNASDIIVWHGDGGIKPILVPDWYFPDPAYLVYASLWGEWYDTKGKQGEKPPAPARRQMELYDRILATPDGAEQQKLMKQILQIAKEQFYMIGISSYPPSYGIAKRTFHNVPKTIIDPAQMKSPLSSCQMFVDA